MNTLMDWLNPAAVVDRFDTVRKLDLPDPPGRPDMADVLMLGNEGIEEVNDSVIDAEFAGVLRRLDYPLPLEPR